MKISRLVVNRILFFLIAILATESSFALDRLKSAYTISYGDLDAPVKIIQYFSFTCPSCVNLFRKEFDEIKAEYIDTKKVFWTFHPVPMDALTIRAMDCLEKLTPKEKSIFLEVMLEEILLDDEFVSILFMKKAMESFGKPTPDLQDNEYLSSTRAFQDSFEFLTQEEKIMAVPTIEINGKMFPFEVPEKSFIDRKVQKFLTLGNKDE